MFMAAMLQEEHSFLISGRMLADVSEGKRPGHRHRLCDSSSAETAWSERRPQGTTWLKSPQSSSTMSVENAAWLASCPLAGCSAKCYYTGVTTALCSETGLQHSPEIRVENTEAVCNDFHSEGYINAYDSNGLGYS